MVSQKRLPASPTELRRVINSGLAKSRRVHLDAPFLHVNRCFALIAISQQNARARDVMNVVMAGKGSAVFARKQTRTAPHIWGFQEETHQPKNSTLPNEAIVNLGYLSFSVLVRTPPARVRGSECFDD